MRKTIKLLFCRGDPSPSHEFLMEYQRSVLCVLEKEGIIEREQLSKCIKRLEKGCSLLPRIDR